MFVPFVDPITHENLQYEDGFYKSEISEKKWPIINEIPRFCDLNNYSNSFGYQWNIFSKNQIDSFSGTDQSEKRFYLETSWSPEDLNNKKILEVGCGAGRFTEVVLSKTNANLHSFDFSNAVYANYQNNSKFRSRLRLSQASLYEIPYKDKSFDKIFCLGVLQHTPNFDQSLKALVSKLSISGELVVDFYPVKSILTFIHSKYIFRLITPYMPKKILLGLIRLFAPLCIYLFDLLCFLGLSLFTRFIPITDLRLIPKKLSSEERKEWAIMDTFDAFSPRFDNPKSIKHVSSYLKSLGCEISFAGYVNFPGGKSAVVRAIRKR